MSLEGDALFALLRRQRAHRSFATDPIDEATIEKLLVGATHAPSAENSQPWEFVVVREANARTAIGEIMARAWAAGREWSKSRLSEAVFADVDLGLGGGTIAAAPVLIVVGANRNRAHPQTIASSVFPAAQNILLGATALGLGSALTTIAATAGDELRTTLDLPEHFVPVAVIPIGFPGRQLGPGRREAPRVTWR